MLTTVSVFAADSAVTQQVASCFLEHKAKPGAKIIIYQDSKKVVFAPCTSENSGFKLREFVSFNLDLDLLPIHLPTSEHCLMKIG